MSPADVAAIWGLLSPDEKAGLIQGVIDIARGKPPKPVRIAEMRKRKIAALAKVIGKL